MGRTRLPIWVAIVVVAGVMTVGGAATRAQGSGGQQPAGDEEDFSAYLEAGFFNRYVWRGINVADDPVIQPAFGVSWKGLTAEAWGNLDLTDVNGTRGRLSEVNISLEYAWSAGMVELATGAVYYSFPQGSDEATTEVFGRLGLDVPLNPTVTLYRDVDEAEGFYVSLGIGHSIEGLVRSTGGVAVGLDLGLEAGYGSDKHNRFYYGAGSAPADLLLSAGFPIGLGNSLTITPVAAYAHLLDRKVRDALGQRSHFFFGVTLVYEF